MLNFVNLRSAARSRLTMTSLKCQVRNLKLHFQQERRVLPKKDFELAK
jgi:hypothetical protein